MSDILITDSISTTEKFFDTICETEVEQDILLADYDKAVFKIVKTNIEHIITQKYINGNKLVIEGFFRISVFYQPPQGANITVITKKQPFQKQLDMSSAVTGHHFISVTGRTQYVNTRAVNSSRISVNGVYSFAVKAYTAQQLPVITAINSPSVCTDSREITGFSLCGSAIKQFSMEDETDIPRQTEKILGISAHNTNMTVQVYRDRINIKGDVAADIAYTVPENNDILHLKKNFAYNQVVDISGTDEKNAAYAELSVISFTVTQNEDSKKINCILTAQLDVKTFCRESVFTALDAFSKKYEYSSEKKTIAYSENIQSLNKNLRYTIEDVIGTGYTPVHHFINISAPYLSADMGRNILKAKLTVSAIVKNSQNEYECFTKSRDITVDAGTEINSDDELLLACQPVEATTAISEDILRANVSIGLSGYIIRKKEISVISLFTEDTEKPVIRQPDALILYYGKKGEKVFDIAMRYRTDISVITAENNLESDILYEDRMLIIPAFGL